MYASKVVALAQSWIGKKESNGTHKFIIDIYNSYKPHPRSYKMTYNDPWCATFVSAIAIKLGYTKIMPVECSCSKMIELYKALGSWVEADNRVPVPGDVLFYDWDDNGVGDNKNGPDHVGIVEKVVDNKITVIEGNYSNAVKRRVIDVNGKYIRGYAVPKYTAEPKKTTTTTKKSIDAIAKEVLDGKWGNGDARKSALTKAGYDYAKVQARVNELINTYSKGGKITLKNAPLYKSATTSTASRNISGTYYIYDGEKINGRYRITNKATNCGKKPVWLYVTGFVKI
jgi:hypothetical protein